MNCCSVFDDAAIGSSVFTGIPYQILINEINYGKARRRHKECIRAITWYTFHWECEKE